MAEIQGRGNALLAPQKQPIFYTFVACLLHLGFDNPCKVKKNNTLQRYNCIYITNIIEILNNSKSVNYCKYKSLKLPLFPISFTIFVAHLMRTIATIVNICKYGNGKRTYQAATA